MITASRRNAVNPQATMNDNPRIAIAIQGAGLFALPRVRGEEPRKTLATAANNSGSQKRANP